MKIDLKYVDLRKYSVFFAAVSIIVFFIGWLSLPCAVIFSVLLIAAVAALIKTTDENDYEKSSLTIPKKTFWSVIIIAALWCFFAGQGGFFHQSSDHEIRNVIFHDLIKKPWPVTYSDGDQMLSYYIAYWMVPSLVGKAAYLISGSAFAGYLTGNIALLIWSTIGVSIVLFLVILITSSKGKSHPYISVLMFIFFSGLDALGNRITGYGGGIYSRHYEWWAVFMQFSSITTCLFWVFNQAIVSWMMILCILNERSMKNFAFLGLLAFPFGPFPFVGIVIMCVIKGMTILIGDIKNKKAASAVKSIFSLQNIFSAVAVAVPTVLYFTANVMLAKESIDVDGEEMNPGFRLHHLIESGDKLDILCFISFYLLFILLEEVIYFLFLYNRNAKKPFFIFSMIALALTPMFMIGTSYDFCMRVSIPMITYMAVEFITMIIELLPENIKVVSPRKFVKRTAEMIEKKEFFPLIKKNAFLISALIFFYAGALNPYNEFQREIIFTNIYGIPLSEEAYFEPESLEEFEARGNFVADNYKGSNFYKYICKK